MKLDTIVALATPPMKSALAIIRVSGEDCFSIVSKVFSKDITKTNEKTIYIGDIVYNNKIIDQVVLLAYKGPKSFTGENLVEIISHGSVLIANEIIELLISCGARMATNGEYSSRAFLNNKIDLIEAEAINDVINATSKEAKALSMLSLQGETSKLVAPIKKRLADIISLIEVNIDYPEYEDIEVANKDTIISYVDELVPTLDKLTIEGEKGRIIKEGIKVALVGKPNVGKSSILNALIGEDKAIVTDIAGTTRDIVEGDINLNGIILHILDTAGIRKVDDKIESIGVDKSIASIKHADLVLVVIDGSKEIDENDKKILDLTANSHRIVIFNKVDQVKNIDKNKLYVSALNKDIEPLKKAILKEVGISEESFNIPSLNNSRQIGLLKRAKESLVKAKEDCKNDLSIDLISVSLLDAYQAILEILGENNQLDLSKEIFSRFCVGK